jgi:hypothetical protein
VDNHIFDRAHKSIFALMEGDAFPRFLRSPIYKDLKRQLIAKEQELHVLKKVDLA